MAKKWEATRSVMGDWVITCGDELIAREVRYSHKDKIAAAPIMLHALQKALALCGNHIQEKILLDAIKAAKGE